MTPDLMTPGAWIAVVIGGLAVVFYLVRALAMSLNVDALATQLCKLIAAGNVDRAMKLTRAAPQSPHCNAARAAMEACVEGLPQSDHASNFRRAGDGALGGVLGPARARYVEAFDRAMRPLRFARIVGVVGAIALVAVIVAWRLNPSLGAQAAVAGGGLLAFALSARSDLAIVRGGGRLFDVLGASLDGLIRSAKPTVTTATR